jgi:GAF domain-containing protein
MNNEPMEEKLDYVVSCLGPGLDANRVYLFIRNESCSCWRGKCQWNQSKTKSLQKKIECLKDEGFGLFVEKLKKREIVTVPATSEIKGEGVAKDFLKSVGSNGGIAVPIFSGEKLWGSIGYAYKSGVKTWKEENIALLVTVADMIGWLVENGKKN